MKKIIILCCAILASAYCAFGQKPNRKYCETGSDFIVPVTPANFDVIYFYCQTHLKKIKASMVPEFEGISGFNDIINEAMDDVDVLACEKKFYLFSKIDSTLEYDGNEKLIMETVLNQKIMDLSIAPGRVKARNILYAITVLIERQLPTSRKGKLKIDLQTMYYFGWVKLMNGDIVIPYLHCITNSNEHLWEIGIAPTTGTLRLRNSYFLGEQ